MSSHHSSSHSGSTSQHSRSSHSSKRSVHSSIQQKRNSPTDRAFRKAKRDYVKSYDDLKKCIGIRDEVVLEDSQEYLRGELLPIFGRALDDCEAYIALLENTIKNTPPEETQCLEDLKRRASQARGVKEGMTKSYGDRVQYISSLKPETSTQSLLRGDVQDSSRERISKHSTADSKSKKSGKSKTHSVPPMEAEDRSSKSSSRKTVAIPKQNKAPAETNIPSYSISTDSKSFHSAKSRSSKKDRNRRLQEIAMEEELDELERKKIMRKKEKLRLLAEEAKENCEEQSSSEDSRSDTSSDVSCRSPAASHVVHTPQPDRIATTVLKAPMSNASHHLNTPQNVADSRLNPTANLYVPPCSSQPKVQIDAPIEPVNWTKNHGYSHDFQVPPTILNPLPSPGYSNEAGAIDKLLHLKVMERRDMTSKFDGSPLRYISFRNEFNLLMHSFPNDTHYLFNELLASVTGDALAAILHCKDLLSDPKHALLTALTVLKRDFGDDYLVRQAHLKSITDKTSRVSWDSTSLRTLLSHLERCKTLLQNSSHRVYLDSPDTIKAVVERLPQRSKNSFLRACTNNRLSDPANPGFDFLIRFIEAELKQVSNPFAALVSDKDQDHRKNLNPKFHKKARSNTVNKENIPQVQAPHKNASSNQRNGEKGTKKDNKKKPPDNQGTKRKCPCCNIVGHRLKDCHIFQNLSVNERWDRIKKIEAIICPACFGEHKLNKCESKYDCNTCHSTRHHSLLCNAKKAGNPENASASAAVNVTTSPATTDRADISDQDVLSLAVTNPKMVSSCPVYVRVVPLLATSSTGTSARIYALLDSGSDSTLCTDRLVSLLKLSGKPCQLRLEGVNGTKSVPALEVSFLIKGTCNGTQVTAQLNSVTSVPSLPRHAQSIPSATITSRHPHLADLQFPPVSACQIDIIIGADQEPLHQVLESRTSPDSSLHAHRTPLGWVLAGPDDRAISASAVQRSITSAAVCEVPSSYALPIDYYENISDSVMNAVKQIIQTCEVTPQDEEPAASIEDEKVLELFARERYKTEDGQMVTPLPWRDRNVVPDNLAMAESRLKSLRAMLLKNPTVAEFYVNKMKDYLEKEYFRIKDPSREIMYPKRIWRLPHFPTKQIKTRVVIDAAASYHGVSFNSLLMQGPDLMQPLVDVLLRFRQDSIAFTCDIKDMFHQVKLPPQDQGSAVILWFKDHNIEQGIPEELECGVHAFGWTSSPTAAIYSVLQTALSNESGAHPDTVQVMVSQLYMDDCLNSEVSVDMAITRIQELIELAGTSGFQFTKFISNSREVLQSIDPSRLLPSLQQLDLNCDDCPTQKVLGVYWDPSSDKIVVRINIKEKPQTKRGILSMLHQVFDPLGITIPFIIAGRRILQAAFARTTSDDWDSPIPEDLRKQWNAWLTDLVKLEDLYIPRCYHLQGDRPLQYEVHTFSDASEVGLGCASYLRFWKADRWGMTLIRGRGRLIPLNVSWSMPRYELQAAVMAAELHKDVLKALEIPISKSLLWTDSATVLSWLTNTARRPKVFVYNRRRDILRDTDAVQWKCVHTQMNPADLATRGISPQKASVDSMWLTGPPFLLTPDNEWPEWKASAVNKQDLELVPESSVCSVLQTLCCIESEETAVDAISTPATLKSIPLDERIYGLLWKFSSLQKLLRVVAWLRRLSSKCKPPTLTFSELEASQLCVLRLAQAQYFSPQAIKNMQLYGYHKAVEKCPQKDVKNRLMDLLKLAPYVDETGLLRVGGRLQNSSLPEHMIHPIVLPRRHQVTRLIIEEIHDKNHHFGGPSFVLNHLVQRFWIQLSTVKFYLDRCLPCIHIRAQTGSQVMAPLPAARVTVGKHPFDSTGVDYFGPVLVKVKRSSVKRWIALFTCLSIRAIHLEVVHTLETSSFLQAFFRFRSARGNTVKTLYSDNATTFHGADNDLKQAIKILESNGFGERLRTQGVEWTFNPPLASHQGGAWERLIRSVRKVLLGIPALQLTTPTDETLLTYIKEAEAIVNNRPLTKTSGDINDLPAITPLMILTGSLGAAAPVDQFHNSDQLRNDWRYTQIAADQFWERFVKEYLVNLQPRAKWHQSSRNLQINDIVLVKESRVNYRPNYPKALVIELFPGKDGFVRSVKVRFANGKTLVRDVRKLVPLECNLENK